MKILLAPKVLWNEADFCFADNTVENYVEENEAAWGVMVELPSVPCVGNTVCLSNWKDNVYHQLKEYLRLPTTSVTKFVNAYRFHKNLKGEEMSWGEENPDLLRYDNEELLVALCYSRIADSLVDAVWTVTNVSFIPDSEVVFAEVTVR
ncbi:MAG: hypothetical protein IKQ72_05130 [Bacteroidaceae bacterium]|nr:hypothetical protein [Bacteroidaceae bacterium]